MDYTKMKTKTVQAGTCVFPVLGGQLEKFMTYTPLLNDAGLVTQVVAMGVDRVPVGSGR